jgi:hypothetical protein
MRTTPSVVPAKAGTQTVLEGPMWRAATRTDRGRESVLLPLPPNRTSGSPAYGSPVGGFTWLRIDELHHHRKEIPADKQRNVHCPFLPIRVVNMRNFDRHSVFSLAAEAAPACLARGHWRWLRFCFDRRYASTSLPPLAPSPLRDFTATMEALTPVGPALRSRTGCLNTVSFNRQVSLIHASDRPIIPPPTTLGLPPSLSHPTPQRVGLLTRVSPGFATESQARQLSGRIAFVILRTDRSPPAAPHPASWRRSCSRLQAGEGVPEEDLHLSDQMRFQAHDSRFRGNDKQFERGLR